jgi:preprotein translocase subunit YajC
MNSFVILLALIVIFVGVMIQIVTPAKKHKNRRKW